MSEYRKFVVAIVGAAAILLSTFLPDVSPEGTIFGIPQDTVVAVVVSIITAIGVRQVPNG